MLSSFVNLYADIYHISCVSMYIFCFSALKLFPSVHLDPLKEENDSMLNYGKYVQRPPSKIWA
jgi:hypothetical protein